MTLCAEALAEAQDFPLEPGSETVFKSCNNSSNTGQSDADARAKTSRVDYDGYVAAVRPISTHWSKS
jgi:hypothetical protein